MIGEPHRGLMALLPRLYAFARTMLRCCAAVLLRCCAAVPHSFIRIRHELALRLALAATFCLLLRKDQFFFRAHEHLIQRILQKLHDLLQKVHVQSQSNARKLKFQRGTTPAF